MIWNNLSALSNYDIIAIIDGIQSGAVDFTFDDLKRLQTELISRRMEARYMSMVGEIMRKMIEKEELREETPPVPEQEYTRPIPTRVPYDSEEFASTMAIPVTTRRKRDEEPEEELPPIRERRDFSQRVATSRRTPSPRPVQKPTAAAIFEEDEEDGGNYREFPALSFLVLLFKILGWLCVGGVIAAFIIISLRYGGENLLLMAATLGASIVTGVVALFTFYAAAESIELKLEIVRLLSKSVES